MLSTINNYINTNYPDSINNYNNHEFFINLSNQLLNILTSQNDDYNQIFNSIQYSIFSLYNFDIFSIDSVRDNYEQVKFRNNIINRYKNCLITNDSPLLCQACHIIPYSISKNFDTDNGILLNNCFHSLFDKYLISFNNNMLVMSPKIINDSSFSNYHHFNNKFCNIHPNSLPLLNIHFNNFKIINNIK